MKKETYALNHPAFPNNSIGNPDWDGMTLRDYFAAKLMVAYINKGMTAEDAAEYAYDAADAMLKARQL